MYQADFSHRVIYLRNRGNVSATKYVQPNKHESRWNSPRVPFISWYITKPNDTVRIGSARSVIPI